MSDKFNFWIQTLTSIALIIGLALVVWELQQARDATTSELYSQGFQIISDSNNTILGEDAAQVLLKACDSPAELSREELFILQTYYEDLLNRQRRIQWISRQAGFYSDEIASSTDLGVWHGIFSTEPGRAYWRSTVVESELRAVGDAALDGFVQLGTPDCGEFLDQWHKELDVGLKTTPTPDQGR